MRPIFRFLIAGVVVLVTVWFYTQLARVPHLSDLLQHGAPVQEHHRIVWGTSSGVVDGIYVKPTRTIEGGVVTSQVEEVVVVTTAQIPNATARVKEVVSGVTYVLESTGLETGKAAEPTMAVTVTEALDVGNSTTNQGVMTTTAPQESITTPTVAETKTAQEELISTSITSPPRNDKIAVMGALTSEDTTWATTKLQDWDSAIYIVDNDTAPLHTAFNKGREANAYLSYVLDNYNDLPATIAFVHSHEKGYPKAWHTDTRHHSNVESLNMLNTAFIQKNGYANLRCISIPGCPDEVQPFRDPVDPSRSTEVAFADAWKQIFGNEDVPSVVGVACCAQFAVSREQVLKRTLEEYQRMHRWLMETELDDDTSGRVFEYLWHIVFGKEAVYCPSMRQCYLDVYNLG